MNLIAPVRLMGTGSGPFPPLPPGGLAAACALGSWELSPVARGMDHRLQHLQQLSLTSSETSPSMRVLSRARPLFSAALSMMCERPYGCSLVRQHHHQSPEVVVGLVYFTTKFLQATEEAVDLSAEACLEVSEGSIESVPLSFQLQRVSRALSRSWRAFRPSTKVFRLACRAMASLISCCGESPCSSGSLPAPKSQKHGLLSAHPSGS